MSSITWQMYVDYIKAKGNVDEVMIVDAEDCNHWASTPDFMVTFCLMDFVFQHCSSCVSIQQL
jgi:hypothetical protein